MRVALCTDGVYPQAMGGMQRHSRLLAEHLARSGQVSLSVVHPHHKGIFDSALGIDEVVVTPINQDKLYLNELYEYSKRVAACMEELNPDIILSQGFCIWWDRKKWGGRTIVHPHGLEMFQMMTMKEKVLGYPFRKALRSIARDCTAVISLGGKLTDILHEQVDGSTCEVITIPNAVEIPHDPPPFPSVDRPLTLLFVGRFAFNKGLDILMAVANRLVQDGLENDVCFELAGDGPLREKFESDGLPANVRLHGRVDDEELDELYAASHALVLPTRFEGMPTVVLEAMARSRPILVSDVGATAEQVNAHNGYLIQSGSEQELYDAIRSMLERPIDVWRKMGEYSYQRATELFSWPQVTGQFIELFRTVSLKAAQEPR